MGARIRMTAWLVAAFAAQAAPGSAQDAPQRSSTLVVYGDDRCPQSSGNDDIVVCARRPENERYRVPKPLRDKARLPGGIAWGSQVAAMEEATRFTRPDSCSVVGSGGQSGCFAQSLRQWRSDRNAARAEAAQIP
ncbi:MAG: hypothetical protein JWO25_1711 [Alphaproteobacteria bacterium]|nr:hypothetical protein [Alphaproteobacteria bacterium]MDB5722613.1 hypothetical protein [Alphaproteobacteria bacterium]